MTYTWLHLPVQQTHEMVFDHDNFLICFLLQSILLDFFWRDDVFFEMRLMCLRRFVSVFFFPFLMCMFFVCVNSFFWCIYSLAMRLVHNWFLWITLLQLFSVILLNIFYGTGILFPWLFYSWFFRYWLSFWLAGTLEVNSRRWMLKSFVLSSEKILSLEIESKKDF